MPRIGEDDGRGERVYGDLARHFRFRRASDEPGYGGERKRDQRTALMAVSHRDGDAPPGEPQECVEKSQHQDRAEDRQNDEPPVAATVVTIAATSGMNRRSQYRLMSRPYSAGAVTSA